MCFLRCSKQKSRRYYAVLHSFPLLVIPSQIIARGVEQIFEDLGEFRVTGILSDLSHGSLGRLRQLEADVLVVDPSVFGVESRPGLRNLLADYTDAPLVAIQTSPCDEDSLRQFDAVINLYDSPPGLRGEGYAQPGDCGSL